MAGTVGKNFARMFGASIALFLCVAAAQASPKNGENTYHAGKAYLIGGQQFDHVTVTFDAQGSLIIQGCETCQGDTYRHLSDASAAIGKRVYQLNDSDFIIEEAPGLLVWAKFPVGLGKKLWSRLDPYNVLAKDRSFVRQLYTDASMQEDVKKSLIAHSREFKKRMTSNTAVSMR